MSANHSKALRVAQLIVSNLCPACESLILAHTRALQGKFYAYTRGQIEELLTRYGKIDVLWFDQVGWPGADIHPVETVAWIRSLQPGIVINDRWRPAEPALGDFATHENRLAGARPDTWWESCQRWMTTSWGYDPHAQIMSTAWVLEQLVRACAGGGNFLLNMGPRPDGTMPPEFYKGCAEMAAWMAHSRESVIGTGPAPQEVVSSVPVTRREGVWYLHVLPEHEGPVEMRDIPRPQEIKLLRTGTEIPWQHDGTKLTVAVPGAERAALDDVVAVHWETEPRL